MFFSVGGGTVPTTVRVVPSKEISSSERSSAGGGSGLLVVNTYGGRVRTTSSGCCRNGDCRKGDCTWPSVAKEICSDSGDTAAGSACGFSGPLEAVDFRGKEWSDRLGRDVVVPRGRRSDGLTGRGAAMTGEGGRPGAAGRPPERTS